MNDELAQRAANEETSYVGLNSRKRRLLMKLYILLSLIPIVISVISFFVIQSELSNQQSSLTLLQTENSALNTSLTPLQSQSLVLQASLEALQTTYSALNASLTPLQSQSKVLQTSVEILQTENSALSASLTTMQDQNKALQTSVEALQTENSALQSSLTAMNTSLQDQVSILQNQTILIPFSVNSTESIQLQCNAMYYEAKMVWTYETPTLSDNGGNLFCFVRNSTLNSSYGNPTSLSFAIGYDGTAFFAGGQNMSNSFMAWWFSPGVHTLGLGFIYDCGSSPPIVYNFSFSGLCTIYT